MVNCPRCNQAMTSEGSGWYKCCNAACPVMKVRVNNGYQIDEFAKGEATYDQPAFTQTPPSNRRKLLS
jgi:hypothetical protein